MKKYLKYMIAALIIVIVSGIYSNTDKKVPIYDAAVDTSYYGNMGELVNGLVVRQEFICEKNVLNGISIKCATFGNVLSSVYEYQILDGDTEKVLREGTINASEVPNSRYYTFYFEQLKNCKNQRLTFVLKSENAVSGNAMTVYNVPKGSEDAQLTLNTDKFEHNTLAMRTISHMFDVETFVCVGFCLFYLFVFIKVLYKFFS